MFQITLEAARINAKMTQKESAKRIGVSVRALQCWEAGKTFPDVVTFRDLCKIYNCPTDVIFLPSNITFGDGNNKRGA